MSLKQYFDFQISTINSLQCIATPNVDQMLWLSIQFITKHLISSISNFDFLSLITWFQLPTDLTSYRTRNLTFKASTFKSHTIHRFHHVHHTSSYHRRTLSKSTSHEQHQFQENKTGTPISINVFRLNTHFQHVLQLFFIDQNL